MTTDASCPYLLDLPELFSLSKMLKRPDLYESEVKKQTDEARNENEAISHGSAALFHRAEPWDSRVFGLSVGKIEFVLGNNLVDIDACVKEFLGQKKYEYIVIRLSQHHIGWIQSFEKHGAILLDTTVDMALLTPSKQSKNDSHVVTAENVSKDELLACSASFNLGRFFTDPEIKTGSLAYREWVENSLNKKAADEVLAYVDGKKQVHGLLTLKADTFGDLKILKIPLVVKHPNSTLSGISHTLIAAAFDHTKSSNFDAALISTQGNNIAAQLGYLNAGFRPYNTGVTMRIKSKA